MKGVGKTVFSGDRVEGFDVEILGVLENAGPRQSIILARLSGGPLERTGVMQGMSGSPVYIDGRLVGAVAMGFPFSKESIAGIRPIEEMLRVAARAPTSTARVSLSDSSVLPPMASLGAFSAGTAELIDIATPLSFSGFTQATVEHFGPQLRSLGFSPQQAVSGGNGPGVKSTRPLEPGSMISVQLVSGDMSIGADGTVTLLDGNRLYAFGHRFLAVGPTELPFARANVLALLPNVSSSFKISSSGEWIGAITSDNNAAILGEIGKRPRMVPLSVTVNGAGGKSTYRMDLVNDRLLSPLLFQMVMYSALDATERTLGPGNIGIHGKFEFEGSPPVKLENVYAGDFNVPLQASLAASMPLAYALQNALDALNLRSIELTLDVLPEKRQMQIDQLWASRRDVHPGEVIDLTLVLMAENGSEVTKTIHYPVPIGAPTGPLYFTVADGGTTNSAEYRHFAVTQPRPAAQIISFLNALRGNSKAYVRVWRADPAYLIQGEDLPDPPPSVAMVLNRTHSPSPSLPRTSKVAEFEIGAGDIVINGSKTVQVDVKE
ncbi:MAG TPA: SpoIVB peptidase S55 domain-containing protein [Bryobacteraceae bacterium]|nr:SpoIVB peptidase S55 domain-containing protein [Bryobacteraceae bacterium]